VNWEIIHLGETESTNRWLKEHDLTANTVVWTDYQTAGRGCGSNTWESERGKNLLFSMMVHPSDIPATRQFSISMAVSMTIADVMKEYFDGVSIKWPNDIYWNDRKLCGILIEHQLSGTFIRQSIIGVGLNVNQTVFTSDAPNPVSMCQIVGYELDCQEVLQKILERFSLEDIDADRYRTLLYRKNGFYTYCDTEGQFEAELVTVEDDGHLLLRDRNGRQRRYAFKEVAFLIEN